LNNYDPNQHSQTYVVAQGSASSGNPSLFPENLTNYYTNVFNPNVNTQFLQNANPPNTNFPLNPQQNYGPGNVASVGIPVSRSNLRNTINYFHSLLASDNQQCFYITITCNYSRGCECY
jgi:hypothetical protein